MQELDQVFLEKAEQNLDATESEFANGRYDTSASRAYYACFQAAIYALRRAGIGPARRQGQWGHDFVQAQFNGELINRRKQYPSALRPTLSQNYALRIVADYTTDRVTQIRAARAATRAEDFVEAVRTGGGDSS